MRVRAGLLLLALAFPALASPGLGRLFLTPQQRGAISASSLRSAADAGKAQLSRSRLAGQATGDEARTLIFSVAGVIGRPDVTAANVNGHWLDVGQSDANGNRFEGGTVDRLQLRLADGRRLWLAVGERRALAVRPGPAVGSSHAADRQRRRLGVPAHDGRKPDGRP